MNFSKEDRLEVYGLRPDGAEGARLLSLELTIPVYGRIVLMKAFRPHGMKRERGDFVFLTTEKYDFCVIRHGKDGGLETVATGNLEDRACRPVDAGQLGAVDRDGRLIVLHLFQGLLKVIPVVAASEDGSFKFEGAFNVRVEALQICSMAIMMDDAEEGKKGFPVLAILHETVGGGREVKSYLVDPDGKGLGGDGPFTFDADEDSHMLVPVPSASGGGLLVLADECIQYYCHKHRDAPLSLGVTMKKRRLTSCTAIDEDGFRFLLGDNKGQLMVLLLLCHDPKDRKSGVRELRLESLGVSSISSSLVYLDEGKVFVGSRVGASQLVRLSSKRLADGSFCETIQTFPSAAPLVDLCVTGLDSSGQGAIVACAGAMKEGHLAVIRRGISAAFLGEGSEAIPFGITGLWPVSLNPNEHHLVCSGYTSSALLHLDLTEGILEAVTTEGPMMILSSSPSLLVGQHGPLLFQVCPASINYGSTAKADANRKIWIPQQPSAQILGAAQLDGHLAIILSTSFLVLFSLSPQGIHQKAAILLPTCPSALSLMPSKDGKGVTAIVALWSLSLISLDLSTTNNGTEGSAAPLTILEGLPAICRSLHVCQYEDKGSSPSITLSSWLFAGLANGSIVYGKLNGDGLCQVRRAHIGQQPVSMLALPQHRDRLIGLSDRATLIIQEHGRPHFLSIVSTIDEPISLAVPLLNTPSNLMFMITASQKIFVGSLQENGAKLHTERVSMGETLRKTLHLKGEGLFAVISVKPSPEAVDNFSAFDTSSVSLIDDTSFELVDRFSLPAKEMVQCLLVIPQTSLLLVGTALLPEDGDQSPGGRLLTFSISSTTTRILSLIHAQRVNGTVYALAWLADRLIASINGQTCVFRQQQPQAQQQQPGDGNRWRLASSHHGQVIGVHIDVLGPDLISIGDMLRSANLLRLDLTTDRLHEIARDYSPAWASCVRFIDDAHLLMADDRGNLCQLVKNTDPNFVTERLLLEPSGAFHLGSLVNALVPGSLSEATAAQIEDNKPSSSSSSFIFGTSSGAIGTVSVVRDKDTFTLLQSLQQNILAVSQPVGLLSHQHWRAASLPSRPSTTTAISSSIIQDHPCFIDGDVIQRFPGLPADLQKIIVNGGRQGEMACSRLPFTKSVAEIIDLVDDLGSRH